MLKKSNNRGCHPFAQFGIPAIHSDIWWQATGRQGKFEIGSFQVLQHVGDININGKRIPGRCHFRKIIKCLSSFPLVLVNGGESEFHMYP